MWAFTSARNKTSLDRGWTNQISLTHDLDLHLLPWPSIPCELWSLPSHMQKFKVNSRSVLTIDWKQTDGQTDRDDCITSVANAVGNQLGCIFHSGEMSVTVGGIHWCCNGLCLEHVWPCYFSCLCSCVGYDFRQNNSEVLKQLNTTNWLKSKPTEHCIKLVLISVLQCNSRPK